MHYQDIERNCPAFWSPMNPNSTFELIPVVPVSEEYELVLKTFGSAFALSIEKLYRVQNPLLLAKFRMKIREYAQRGDYYIQPLFHDTSRTNVMSIAKFNFDWKFGERFKYGPGVYFSTTPQCARRHSSKNNGPFRSMFLTDVLVQNVQNAHPNICLPDEGFDTVVGENGNTIVKYFDCEYYPSYVVEHTLY